MVENHRQLHRAGQAAPLGLAIRRDRVPFPLPPIRTRRRRRGIRMADVNRGKRPLSPFMFGQVYRPQLGSMMSIAHRVTGCALAGAALLVVWWFLAAASGADSFARADGLLTSWLGGLVLILAMAALWYHAINGIRHLIWDTGHGLGREESRKAGLAVLAVTAVATLATLIAAI
jgi:succinate dehydrogenase / fumarate reductase, cytochrome b subunit